MLRRDLLRAGAMAGAATIAGCTGGSTGPAFEEGFEDGLGDWESGAAIGPEVELSEFEWEFGVSEEEAASGDRSLRIWNEGDYDDGVTWGVHPVSVEAGQAYQITASAQFWSESESFNTLRDAVMRLGPEPPEVEEDFPQPGVNTTDLGETPYGGLREPLWLADGWREYTFEWTTPELSTGTLYIALGTSVIWEGDATHYIDDITVEVETQ
ncbi:twin-arginine translocation signal domain-containing protein [Haloarcula mannanilytica]|nr:twin-arginine translocation signal domain-containing protein [Haloarcula mannanilytica]